MLAVVQFGPNRGERTQNLRRLAELTSAACAAGARLVVLPEMAASGYRFPSADAIRPLCEPAHGETLATLAPIARDFGAFLVAGFAERAPDERLFNSALVVSPAGELLATYRKRLLFDDDETWATPGDTPFPRFHTPYGTALVAICMDINGWELPRAARLAPPDVICFPTNWVDEGRTDIHDYWNWRMPTFDGIFLAADRTGAEDGVGFYGRSAILVAGRPVVSAPATGDGWLLYDPATRATASSFLSREAR